MATIARGVAVSPPRQLHATRVSARSDSVRGTASSLASRVKIANIEASRGSQACRVLSIRSSARCWQAGKLTTLHCPGEMRPNARSWLCNGPQVG